MKHNSYFYNARSGMSVNIVIQVLVRDLGSIVLNTRWTFEPQISKAIATSNKSICSIKRAFKDA